MVSTFRPVSAGDWQDVESAVVTSTGSLQSCIVPWTCLSLTSATMTTVTDILNENVELPSLFHGPSNPPLVTLSLGEFLDLQCIRYGSRECLVTPWNATRWTYNDLQDQSSSLARYLHARGVRPGDRIAILSGNRAEYAAVFFACMRVGAVLVILNNTYTTSEAEYALQYTGMPSENLRRNVVNDHLFQSPRSYLQHHGSDDKTTPQC